MSSHVIDSRFLRDLYGTEAMRRIWSDEQLLQRWLDYEAALARAEAKVGLVPADAAAEITRKCRAELFDLDAIKTGIDRTVHPLVPVIWQLSALCEGEAGGYVHWGATTQDVTDTALILQLRDAIAEIEATLGTLTHILAALARTYRETPMAGRTHGQQALPITFGFKVAIWLAECLRHSERLAACKPRLLVGEFGGAVGTLAGIADQGMAVSRALMAELDLGEPLIAWHSSRDHIAEFAAIAAAVTATTGKIAHEIINLQMNEVGEVEERWEAGKVGSSTMPQKRNPMLCETILTLSRLTRQHASLALDAMLHDFERDWSSVQMEWEFVPELCIMTHAALSTTNRVLAMLAVNPDRMLQNLRISGGQLLAERVMFALAEHTGRQKAHDIVHEISMGAINDRTPFGEALKRHPVVSAQLTAATIERLLDPTTYVGLSAQFVDRVLATLPKAAGDGAWRNGVAPEASP
ncbi:MAG TPA: adenylosuccinate lyase [Devosia sp.]|nr:adenylosuccinate lyase [Devosia sp.]